MARFSTGRLPRFGAPKTRDSGRKGRGCSSTGLDGGLVWITSAAILIALGGRVCNHCPTSQARKLRQLAQGHTAELHLNTGHLSGSIWPN